MNLILGAGLAGLSASYHIGHDRCLVLEKNTYPFGHLHVEFRGGFTWDQGPHVSFTKHDYVKNLFADGVDGEFDEYEVQTANFYRGHWIDHPAQSSLYQVPEPLRSQCLESFMQSRNRLAGKLPTNYLEWLDLAFGPVFAREFSAAYTRKYWTRDPAEMTTDWVGGRVYLPKVEDVIAGSKGPLGRQTHYVTKVRYPRRGGYQSFVRKVAAGSQVKLGAGVIRIDLSARQVWTAAGECYAYTRLINTLPLPVFVELCMQATPEVIHAARQLSCSQLLLVNVTAPHPTRRHENWMYVYDENKYSTRINCTEKLTAGNGPCGSTGVQVEVYHSRHKPLSAKPEEVAEAVKRELVEMKLIDGAAYDCGQVAHFTVEAPWANVIFDHQTKPALAQIWSWLEQFGLSREIDDLNPLTDWGRLDGKKHDFGQLVFAGRFGQWKYFWTDDCVLRGQMMKQFK